jgi:hypothetical protein
MTLSRNLSTLGQAVTVDGKLPTANLTGTYTTITFSDNTTQSTSGANGYSNKIVYTSPATYTKSAAMKYIKVTVLGGGGGGGQGKGPGARAAGGGGAGGIAFATFPSANVSSPIAITIGAGGNPSGPNNVDFTTITGGTGGTTSFGSLITATGCAGGGNTGGTGGSGGPTPANKYPDTPISIGPVTPGTLGPGPSGGDGGAQPWGVFYGPLPAAGNGPTPTNTPATPYGYGVGAGGNYIGPQTPGISGAGSAGILIVEEFY